ncbi:MAG TPA: response regulator, partial [Solirubrobacterales bacterium]|nr:response regulator [Solirubrobacterales bacterium]
MSEDDRRIRVLVVDDHDVVQWGFRLLLERQPWVERCLAAHDSAEALRLAGEAKPQVALVDLFLGRQSGAELCDDLRAASPDTKILLIS